MSSASITWQRIFSMPHSKTAKSPTGPAPTIATSPRCTSPAIASRLRRDVDPDPTSAEWARRRGIAVSAGLAEALADPAVKGVVLATPHTLHTGQIAAA